MPIVTGSKGHVPLVEITRTGLSESLHFGSLVVADAGGTVLAQAGDPGLPIYWRSTAKFHQAITLIAAGGEARFALEDRHIAVLCASHNGEPWQTQPVEEVLARAGSSPRALKCGVHEPFGRGVATNLIREGLAPTPLHNTCSGNHAGLIALATLLGVDVSTYDAAENAAQKRALDLVSLFTELPSSSIRLGVDGCGIPTYGTSLTHLAVSYARLACVPTGFPEAVRAGAETIFQSVVANPEMLSGHGELDTEFVRAFDGTALCKLGAEGLCAVAVKPSQRFPNGLGIALKIGDGLGNRARPAALLACLDQLEIGTPEQRENLRNRLPVEVKNNLGAVVGEIRPVFSLQFPNRQQ